MTSMSVFYVSYDYVQYKESNVEQQTRTCVDCIIVGFDMIWSGSHLQYNACTNVHLGTETETILSSFRAVKTKCLLQALVIKCN